jgi:hypothetical protein
MAGKSVNSFGAKNWAPNSPATRYNASGKNREFYTFENAPGLGNYATGGTIIDGGDGYIYHIFTGDGTFAVNRPPAAIDSVDYLVVAGGGAGGGGSGVTIPGGGGGAGGMLFGNTVVSTAPGSYSISIGGGGASNAPGNPSASRHGFDSSAFGLTAEGGGGGGSVGPLTVHANGDPGGSGGGAHSAPPTSGRPGGTGNTPGTIPRQGYPGAPLSMPTGSPPAIGGGGGGAGGAGGYIANGDPVGPPFVPRGYGGPGRLVPQFPIPIIGKAIPSTNYPVWYNDVAEGSTYSGNSGGGLSAGGRAWPPPSNSSPQLNATANTGHGGIGQTTSPGFNGGSGIVCIRYKKNAPYTRATGGTVEPSTDPEHPGVWRHIFTSPGDFTVTDPTLQWIDYLAVGGGGGGAGGATSPGGAGGGGGAGGFVSSIHTSTRTPTNIPEAYSWNPGYSVQVGEQYAVGIGTYPIGIGTGGTGGVGINTGNDGYNTTIGSPGASQIIAVGGGGGGYDSNGSPGGSGGGGSKGFPSPGSRSGGTATPPPNIQGNNGGGTVTSTSSGGGAGGGGAAAVGSNLDTPGGGAGGAGWYSVLSPSSYGTPGPVSGQRYFAGGGGGGGGLSPGPTARAGGAGGAGGGGAGSNMPTVPPSINPATSGTTNTGGGGGGARASTPSTGGNGGPGIVIIQYPE